MDKTKKILVDFLNVWTMWELMIVSLIGISSGTKQWSNQDWCHQLERFSETAKSEEVEERHWDTPFRLVVGAKHYATKNTLSVSVIGSVPFEDVVIQSRSGDSTNLPLIGEWYSRDTPTSDVSCSGASHDTIILHRMTDADHVTVTWTHPHKGNIEFLGLVKDVEGYIWEVSSDYPGTMVHKGQDKEHNRVKRQAQDVTTGGQDVTTAGVVEVSSVSRVTDNQSDTTEATVNATTLPKSTKIDAGSIFQLVIIIGAYVGMYTVFSLLLI